MTPGEARPDEFADYSGEAFSFSGIAWSHLGRPATLQALLTFGIGLTLLTSERTSFTLAVLLVVAGVALGILELTSTSTPLGRWDRVISAAVLLGLGITLLLWPEVSSRIMSRILGGGIAYFGLRDIYRARRPTTPNDVRGWRLIRGLFTFAIGASLWVAPSVFLNSLLGVIGLASALTGLVTAVGNLAPDIEPVSVTEVWGRFFVWLEQRPHTADDRHQLYEKIYFEGKVAKRRLSRFYLLMGFATTIAAFGIISDSTAVVIGAMLVAPLMTPLMGTSLSLVMGWPRRAAVSSLVALGGIGLAIGLSVLFGGTITYTVDPITNSQVASRIAPTMIDLIIAVAAGGAGAFALSRPDVSDALPGVAVAIALVPPLAVVGLMLQGGYLDEAFGALMLFTTNLVAILLVGAVVFLLTGVVPIRMLVARREWIRSTATLVGIAAIVVVVVLGTTGERIRAQAFDRDEAERAVAVWVDERDLEVFSIDVGTDEVEVVVVGPEEPAPAEELADLLASELRRSVSVVVRWVPEQRFVVER